MGKGQEAGDFELGQALREKKTVKWEESCVFGGDTDMREPGVWAPVPSRV